MNPNRLMMASLLIIWLSAGLQQGLAFRMSVFGAQPDFILVSACILGLFAEMRLALIFGFILGVTQSAIVGVSMWQFIVTRMLATALSAYMVESRFQRNIGVAALAAFAVTIICGILFIFLAPQSNIGGTLKATIITALYNAVLALLVYYPIERAVGATSQQL